MFSSLWSDVNLERLPEDRSLDLGDGVSLLDFERPLLSLPSLDLEPIPESDLDLGDLNRSFGLLSIGLLDLSLGDLDLERVRLRSLDSSKSFILLPLSSAPSNLSIAVLMSSTVANSKIASFLFRGCLCASA